MLKGADAAVLHTLAALGLQSRVVRVWGLDDDVSLALASRGRWLPGQAAGGGWALRWQHECAPCPWR